MSAPRFPSLDPLDNISGMLEAANGAAGVLADLLERQDGRGDVSLAAYALGYLIERVRKEACEVHSALMAYRQGLVSDKPEPTP